MHQISCHLTEKGTIHFKIVSIFDEYRYTVLRFSSGEKDKCVRGFFSLFRLCLIGKVSSNMNSFEKAPFIPKLNLSFIEC